MAERGEETAARVRELGRRALAVPTDVMDTEQIRALVTRSAEHFGRIDILVNNAGGVSGRAFLEQSERSGRTHIDLHLRSAERRVGNECVSPCRLRGEPYQ